MTELDTIRRAKMYLDKLAQGVNPLDDMPIPEDEVVNHVRLSRCFTFVSGVLEKVIENGGTVFHKDHHAKGEPFCLPREKLAGYRMAEFPISITEIARRIDELADHENMRKLTYAPIRDWLIERGLLRTYPMPDGKQKTEPTPEGLKMGITQEERMGRQGMYVGILYNRQAQQFILDHLDEIIEAAAEKQRLREAEAAQAVTEPQQY